MKLGLSVLALICFGPLRGQDNPPPKCSISGTVEDSATHQPLEGFTVRLRSGQQSVVSDPKGNFQFKDLDPGTYRVWAMHEYVLTPEKVVSVTSGQDLSGIRLKAEAMGTVVGTVTDENGGPVQKADVSLVARDYYRGKLRYILTSAARTDDKGDYTLEHLNRDTNILYTRVGRNASWMRFRTFRRIPSSGRKCSNRFITAARTGPKARKY